MSNLSNLCPSMWFQVSAFAISHPGQCRVPPLVLYILHQHVIWHLDDGHRHDWNRLVKHNHMWLNIFMNVHLLVCHKSIHFIYYTSCLLLLMCFSAPPSPPPHSERKVLVFRCDIWGNDTYLVSWWLQYPNKYMFQKSEQ